MKHIALVSNSFGSLYNFRYELIMKLLDTGYKVTLVTPMEPDEYQLYKAFEDKGCQIKETPFKRRGTNPLADLSLYNGYLKILKEIKPDLVITYTIKPNVYCGQAAAKLKIPYFSNVTGLGTAFQKDGLLKKVSVMLYKKGVKKANVLFFQNSESQSVFESLGIKAGKYRLLPGSGINLDRFEYKEYPEDKCTFLYVARIQRDKGADEFMYAARQLKKQYDNISFDVVGSLTEEYEQPFKQLESDGIVTLYGWRNDTEKFFEKCSCVVQPSYHEGMSNVCLEAAATGRPLLASDIPGCKEAVVDGQSGYTFKVKDKDALLESMRKFMKLSKEEQKEMGIKGRQHIEKNFDRKLVVDIFINEIQEVIGR